MITITSLTHPVMIAKIRAALRAVALGQGETMAGHKHRAYVKNAKGHAIMRINWLPELKTFVVYGGADWGTTVVTDKVKEALRRSNPKALGQHHLAAMKAILCQDSYKMAHTQLYTQPLKA